MGHRKTTSTDAALQELREFGLAYPGAHTKSPWPGHLDLAVKDKTFAYLSIEGDPFSISCKLPASSGIALLLPFVTPTGYGLGKSGWVSATPPAGEALNLDMFKAWIDESYRAQAPKKLVAQLATGPVGTQVPATKRTATTRTATTRTATTRTATTRTSTKPTTKRTATKRPTSAAKRAATTRAARR